VVDQLLADEQVRDLNDAGENETLWAMTDHLGTIRQTVDSNGQMRMERFFDAFGNAAYENFINAEGVGVNRDALGATSIAFAFTGRLFDATTGLQNNLHRWYDPAVGRWLSEDPIGFAAGDTNVYRYVANQPLNIVDPGGALPINLVAYFQRQALLAQIPVAPEPTVGAGLLQGLWNIGNGFTDFVIGTVNTPAFVWNNTAGWVLPNAPYVPAPDWSDNVWFDEGDWHGWNKAVATGSFAIGTAGVGWWARGKWGGGGGNTPVPRPKPRVSYKNAEKMRKLNMWLPQR
jgi:RHS repeat-associated protein